MQHLVGYIYLGIELQTRNGSVFALLKDEFVCILQAPSLLEVLLVVCRNCYLDVF
jgi:hypothetical protein